MSIDAPDVEGLRVPILSDILGGEIARSKFLIGLYEPAADWLSFVLTLASGVLQEGHVVNFVTTSTPPHEIRRILNRAIPKLKELEAANRLVISDFYSWQTGRKSDEAEAVDSLSIAKLNIERRHSDNARRVTTWSFGTIFQPS